ncbi:MAG: hypothetical protein Kow0069_21590 [Promethearchaeota archaeon]
MGRKEKAGKNRASGETSAQPGGASEPKREMSEEQFYAALSHDVRRRIIKLVGSSEGGFSSFTKLKEALKVSTGTLYHHLEALGPLIEQDRQRKYGLTELGWYAHAVLVRDVRAVSSRTGGNGRTKLNRRGNPGVPVPGLTTTRLNWVAHLFQRHYRAPLPGTLVTISVVSLVGLACAFLRLNATFLFLFTGANGAPPPLLFLRFVLSFTLGFLAAEGITRLAFKNEENFRFVISSGGYVFLPSLGYVAFKALAFRYSSSTTFLVLDRLALFASQVLSIALLTGSLVVNKFVRWEQALSVVLLVHYLSFMAILVETL